MQTEYIATNKALWEARTIHHVGSEFYDMTSFKNGTSSLNDIELELLGDIKGKEIVHLQCHFGQDSISLARMGASVTGIDFSEEAISVATGLANETGANARFICSDVYDAAEKIAAPADIVFTSYGTIGWLPDIDRWASVIARCLKPGGVLVFAEFHPTVWMFDNDISKVVYSYFQREPIVELEEGTYADTSAPISMNSITWNHSISQVYNSLKKAGMMVTDFQEYDYSPYPCFANTVEAGPRKFYIKGLEQMLPMVYSLKAIKQ